MGYTQCDTCVAKLPGRTRLATANYRHVTVPLRCPCLAMARRGRERASSQELARPRQRTWFGSCCQAVPHGVGREWITDRLARYRDITHALYPGGAAPVAIEDDPTDQGFVRLDVFDYLANATR